MRRHWPIAFLALLFAALLGRPVPPPMPLERPLSPAVPEAPLKEPAATPSPRPEAPSAAATTKTETETELTAQHPDEPWRRSAVGMSLLWLARHQNEDGSWGDVPTTIGGRTIGRTGVTSLAVLTFLGAGYTQLSKDEYDGTKVMGHVVKKALQWLIQDQRENGSFASGFDATFDQAIGSLALSEAYGMTASLPLKEPAQRAVDALTVAQGTDGSWGNSETSIWAIHALISAELSELYVGGEVRERALRALDNTPHPGNGLCRIFLTKRHDAAASDVESLVADIPQDDGRDFVQWYHGSNTIHQFEGPDGARWAKWNEPMKRAILGRQGADGCWQGGSQSHTVARSSLASLTLQVYYRYANVQGTASK